MSAKSNQFDQQSCGCWVSRDHKLIIPKCDPHYNAQLLKVKGEDVRLVFEDGGLVTYVNGARA